MIKTDNLALDNLAPGQFGTNIIKTDNLAPDNLAPFGFGEILDDWEEG